MNTHTHLCFQGEAVFLQVKGLDFFWLHPQTLSQLRVQPINRIRVWGIGLENERWVGMAGGWVWSHTIFF